MMLLLILITHHLYKATNIYIETQHVTFLLMLITLQGVPVLIGSLTSLSEETLSPGSSSSHSSSLSNS